MARRIASVIGMVLMGVLMIEGAPIANAVGAASGGTNYSNAAGAVGHKVSMERTVAHEAALKQIGGKARAQARQKVRRTSNVKARAYENAIIRLTNSYRAKVGCGRVAVNASLIRAARRHTRLMTQRQNLSHQLAGEPRLSGRTTAAGYLPWRIVAENLAKGFVTPQDNFNAWIASPAHKANLDDCRLRHIGVSVMFSQGVAWVTQDFGVQA